MTKTYAQDAVLICGSRGIKDAVTIKALAEYVPWDRAAVVLCGMAKGVDLAAYRMAQERGVTVEEYPVTPEEWASLGAKAGPIRNGRMIARMKDLWKERDLQPVVVAVWDGKSPGTRDTITRAKRAGFATITLQVWPRDVEGSTL